MDPLLRFAIIRFAIIRFAITGDILSGNYAVLATMAQRGRNPLRAPITGEDEIRNQCRAGPSRQTSHARGMEAAVTRRDLCRARTIFNSLTLTCLLAR